MLELNFSARTVIETVFKQNRGIHGIDDAGIPTMDELYEHPRFEALMEGIRSTKLEPVLQAVSNLGYEVSEHGRPTQVRFTTREMPNRDVQLELHWKGDELEPTQIAEINQRYALGAARETMPRHSGTQIIGWHTKQLGGSVSLEASDDPKYTLKNTLTFPGW